MNDKCSPECQLCLGCGAWVDPTCVSCPECGSLYLIDESDYYGSWDEDNSEYPEEGSDSNVQE